MDATKGAASDQEAGLPPLSESILAIDVKDRSILGCSLFSTADGTLKIGTDISMAGEDVVEQFLSFAQPTTILVSRRVPESIVAFIEKHAEKSDKGEYFLAWSIILCGCSVSVSHINVT